MNLGSSFIRGLRASCIGLLVVAGFGCRGGDALPEAATATVVLLGGLRGGGPCQAASTAADDRPADPALHDASLAALGERVAALERTLPNSKLVAVGDTFAATFDSPPESFSCERQRAEGVVGLLGRLSPVAVVRGPADLGVHREAIERAAQAVRLPLFEPPRTAQTRSRLDNVLWRVQGLSIGIIGVPGAAATEASAYAAGAAALKAQGADIVLALVPDSIAAARTLVPHLRYVDLLVAGGGDDATEAAVPTPPEVIGGTVLLAARAGRGEVGILELHKRRGEPFVFDRPGSRRALLEAELVALATPDAGDAAPRARREALQAELATLPANDPPGSFVRWRVDVRAPAQAEAR